MRNKNKLMAILSVAFVLLASFTSACEGKQLPPTEIPTYVPSATATSSPIPAATPTITPTPSPTEIAVPLPYYDLPTWMADPDTNILADLFVREEDTTSSSIIPSKLSFLNAATGVWYDMQVPSQARKYFWYDNMHFGLLSNDLQTMYLIDLSTGQVSSEPAAQSVTRLLEANEGYSSLWTEVDPMSPGEIILEYADTYGQRKFSKNYRYVAQRATQLEMYPIVVTERSSEQVIWRSSPVSEYWGVSFAWSPVNDSYLAIVEGKLDDYWVDFPVRDTVLSIYDVTTGDVVSTYEGDIGDIHWSPDGTRILYRDALSRYWNYGFAFKDSPCIFYVQTGENKCIRNIPGNHIPSGYTLYTTSNYQWSPDGKSIHFSYTYTDPEKHMVGNLCIYDLLSGNFTCPTEHLAELPEWDVDWPDGWNIPWHDFSPDMKFIHFCYSQNFPTSDDQSGSSKNGVMDINGAGFISWAGLVMEEYSLSRCSPSWAIWRPLP